MRVTGRDESCSEVQRRSGFLLCQGRVLSLSDQFLWGNVAEKAKWETWQSWCFLAGQGSCLVTISLEAQRRAQAALREILVSSPDVSETVLSAVCRRQPTHFLRPAPSHSSGGTQLTWSHTAGTGTQSWNAGRWAQHPDWFLALWGIKGRGRAAEMWR